ncbi:hypothetical protein LCL95_11540 [Bacillus timonensis]|nr:hypothetical protein [Bacillus timonensis]
MKFDRTNDEDKVRAASKMGAREDILPASVYDEGYDLRCGYAPGEKQESDENGHA